jgi:hypothetical protein
MADNARGLGARAKSFRSAEMRLFARTFVFYSVIVLPLTAMAQTPVATPSPKPQAVDETVRVQPRGNDFMPNSSKEDAVQKRITDFNSTQENLDASFDRKLHICRGC